MFLRFYYAVIYIQLFIALVNIFKDLLCSQHLVNWCVVGKGTKEGNLKI